MLRNWTIDLRNDTWRIDLRNDTLYPTEISGRMRPNNDGWAQEPRMLFRIIV